VNDSVTTGEWIAIVLSVPAAIALSFFIHWITHR